MKKLLILFTCITLLCGCSKIGNMPKNPARPPRDGYSWKIQTGLGLKFYGQENKNTRFVFDQNLSTVSIETTAANKKIFFL